MPGLSPGVMMNIKQCHACFARNALKKRENGLHVLRTVFIAIFLPLNDTEKVLFVVAFSYGWNMIRSNRLEVVMKKWMFGFAVSLFSINLFAGVAVDYAVNGMEFEGYIADAGNGAPLVVIIHDWDGLTDYEIKRAEMLMELGYSAFAIDLYGKGVRPTELADKKKCMSILTDDRPMMREYMRGALEFAKSQGLKTDQAVVMGYCFGGTATLELARSGEPLKGFASFHGGLDLPEGQDYSAAKGQYQIHHSITDGMPPYAALAEALEKQGLPAQLISYTDAPHGWTVFGSPRYRERADRESWNNFLQFLEDVL